MKNRPAKRSADRRQRYLARAYLDLGIEEIDPKLAELLRSKASAQRIRAYLISTASR